MGRILGGARLRLSVAGERERVCEVAIGGAAPVARARLERA